MKKIFTLITIALLAIGGANAQDSLFVQFTADDAKITSFDGKSFSNGDFKLTLVDKAGKMVIDQNSQYFGDANSQKNFGYRLKSGAKSQTDDSKDKASYMKLTIPSEGTLVIYPRSANGSATDRNLVVTQGKTKLYDKVVKDEDAIKTTVGQTPNKSVFPVVTIANVKAGEVIISYPTGTMNFYAFAFVPGPATGISTIKASTIKSDENAPIYNVAGQRVSKDYKGIVIQNGKKFLNNK